MNNHELILDTLHYRIRDDPSFCIVVNIAGIRLAKCSPAVLPDIEEVLTKTVEPVLAEYVKVLEPMPSLLMGKVLFSSKPAFLGLDYLLGAYMLIGARSDFSRVKRFLLASSEKLLIEAILAVPVFFRKMNDGYNFGISSKPEVMDFVQNLTMSESADVRNAALKVVGGR